MGRRRGIRGVWLLGLPLLAVQCAAHAQTRTVHYYLTDPQNNVLAETDAQGNIIARYDYRPYGGVVQTMAPNGPGYSSHVNDPETGLVYMQQRYYDPGTGGFLSVDPLPPVAGDIFKFNRYAYANRNPITNIDPDGRDCHTSGDQVTCDPHVNGLPPVTVTAPPGFPNITSPQGEYHFYNNGVAGKQGSGDYAKAISDALARNPTPGGTASSPQGSYNDASPRDGLLGALGKLDPSPVMTYTRTDANGNTVVFNITLPGHPLFPGYVERGVKTVTVNGHSYSVIVSAGEGLNPKQASWSPVANWIDSVWTQNSKQILNSVGQGE